MGSFCTALDRKMIVVTVKPQGDASVQTLTEDSLQPMKSVGRLPHPIRTRCSFRGSVLGCTNHCAAKNPKTCKSR
ncbi:hypothetical protein CgunFtcFv8_024181 [Champsocephalus gunnari]|uniref:Uncharacterized protein n=1 Tax=Champsocephalus gunnari TaxID=52237 RepID=A0AAN8HLK8_CHAGU|nr:hypothetical protein CgunFtcFv8_024181 [Champsocephalus gunnari]